MEGVFLLSLISLVFLYKDFGIHAKFGITLKWIGIHKTGSSKALPLIADTFHGATMF